jgi:adenylyltransferase/sulfurtransferase
MPLPAITDPAPGLSDAERARTARHAVLPGFGELAQRRLSAARVAVVGVGGLGSPIILALAAAGVGELVVIDDDVVEHSNLQRQVVHGIGDVGRAKVDSAVRAAAALSPETTVRAVRARLDDDSAAALLRDADVVIDGSDSFSTRRAVADACEALGLPLVWGTIQGYDAQVTVFWSAPPAGAPALLLRDLYPPKTTGEPPSCAQVGVLGALCLQVGGVMAVEAIKLITGIGESLLGRVLLIDSLRARQREVPLLPSLESPLAPPPPRAPTVSAAELGAAPLVATVADGTRWIVDVREVAEIATGVIAGARHVPLAEFMAAASAHLPSAAAHPTVLVCEAGVRAALAAEAAQLAGIDVVVLDGGMAAWRRAGLPTTVQA